jgi:hypothetical protein
MPRPQILPVINWSDVFKAGKPWEQWLDSGEDAAHVQAMRDSETSLPLPPSAEQTVGGIQKPVHVIAIAEDWCGDVVRHAPVLARLASVQPLVKIRFITRAQYPDVFIRFLTNGGEAIPKFIFLSDEFVECGNWGPMQQDCRDLISKGKAAGDVGAARRLVSQAYEEDSDRVQVFDELAELLARAASISVD